MVRPFIVVDDPPNRGWECALPLKTAFYLPQTRILRFPNIFGLVLFGLVLFSLGLFFLVLFGYWALAKLDGSLRLG